MGEGEPSREEIEQQLESLIEWRFMRFVVAHALTDVDLESLPAGEREKQSTYRLEQSGSEMPIDAAAFSAFKLDLEAPDTSLGYEYTIAFLRRGVVLYELLYVEERLYDAASEEEYETRRIEHYQELMAARLNALPGYVPPSIGEFNEYLPDQGLAELNDDEASLAVNRVMNKLIDLEAHGLLTLMNE